MREKETFGFNIKVAYNFIQLYATHELEKVTLLTRIVICTISRRRP